MNIHITTINGVAGTARFAQENVKNIGLKLGMKEMGIFAYPVHTDSSRELDCRIDGIIALMNFHDVVILQYPTWNHLVFENRFVDHIKAYHGKLVLFVQDVDSLMWQGTLNENHVREEIAFFNRADLIILPSPAMHQVLKEYGLTVPKVLYQTIWDYPTDLRLTEHRTVRRFHMPGWENRYPYIKNYYGKTPMAVYSREKLTREDDASIQWKGYMGQNELLKEMAGGGFGMAWCEGPYYERYLKMNQSFKVGTFLAAGIPVIVRRGTAYEPLIRENEAGFAVDSLEEADQLVQKLTDEEFCRMYENAAKLQYLVTSGHYTARLLEEAVIRVIER